jgi:hypothetical protein
MARITLRDPVSKWTAQVRLEASEAQWQELEPHLTRFEAPGGLVVFDWPAVIDTVRRLAQVKRPRAISSSRRRPAA